MSERFLGRGWKFPIRLVTVSSEEKVGVSEDEEDIEEAIRIILGTSKGERAMLPDFGCDLHDLMFANIDTYAIGAMEDKTKEALVLWEPRIELIKVKARAGEVENGKVLIDIGYKVRSTNNQFNLVYPFYLKE